MDKDTKYYKQLVQHARKKHSALLGNPLFQKRVMEFRQKWDIAETGLKTDEDIAKWDKRFDDNPVIAVHTDIKKIMLKHKLPPRMELVVYRYCVFNDERLPLSMLGKVHIETEDKEGENFELKLVCDPDTTKRDILAILPFLKEKQEGLVSWKQKKNQPYRYLDRYKYAYDLRQQGEAREDIAKMIRKRFRCKNVFADTVSNYIRAYKKLINM